MDTHDTQRHAIAELDWDGTCSTSWTLTPTRRCDRVRLHLPAREGTPIYPLRYGLAERACTGGAFDTGAYDGIGGDRPIGLRALRPHSYVYVIYETPEGPVGNGYQVTEDARFSSLPAAGADDTLTGSVVLPFLTAPSPDDVDRVFLLVTDTPLGVEAIQRVAGNHDGIRDALTTEVVLADGCDQPHTMHPDDLPAQVQEFDPDVSKRWFGWSESIPRTPSGEVAGRGLRQAATDNGVASAIVVAMHDPVGVLSELNRLLARKLTDLEQYADEAQRKLWVGKMIDLLADQGYDQARSEYENARPVDMQTNRRTTIAQAMQAGNERRNARLSHARVADRDAFIQAHPARVEAVLGEIRTAAEAAWVAFQNLESLYMHVLSLHADSDLANFLDLRRVVAYTAGALAFSEQGSAYLEGLLPPEGPEGFMGRAMVGHPEVKAYQAARAAAGFAAMETVSSVITQLHDTLAIVPADDASRHLSLVTGALVVRGRLKSPAAFVASPYGAAFEVMDGQLVSRQRIPLPQVPTWIRDNLTGPANGAVTGFRPVTVALAADQMIELFQSEEVQAELRAETRRIQQRVHFWHRIKLGLGGLGIWVGATSVAEALRQFSKEDADVLATTLSLGAESLLLGAAGAVLPAASLSARAATVRLSGERATHAALLRQSEAWGTFAIALASGAALLFAVRDGEAARNSTDAGDKALLGLSAALQGAAGGVGVVHVVGRMRPRFQLLVADSSRAPARIASRLLTLSSGKVGAILLLGSISMDVLHSYRFRRLQERRVTQWIERSVWGKHAVDEQGSSNERIEFFRLFREPQIQTTVEFGTLMRSAVTPLGHVRQVFSPDDLRQVTVVLPGWQAQVSAYRITQYRALRRSGVEQVIDDPNLVDIDAVDRFGTVRFGAKTLAGDTVVRYWPNGFTEPALSYTAEN